MNCLDKENAKFDIKAKITIILARTTIVNISLSKLHPAPNLKFASILSQIFNIFIPFFTVFS